MNLIPTPRTRQVARMMIATANEETGADAVLRLLPKVQAEQVPALIGVLLTNTRLQAKIGRPRIPEQFTEKERREANRRYKNGDKSDWVMERYREYQRVNRRAYMSKARPRPIWAPPVDAAYRLSVPRETLNPDTTEVGPGGVGAPTRGLADRMDTTD